MSYQHDIDSDEGYRPIDWDSHLSEPFFTEALPCESCGKPVDCDRRPATWDESLMVGPCCQEIDNTPSVPTCPALYELMMSCETVGELCDFSKSHKAHCPTCQGIKKQIASEVNETRKERVA